MLGIKPVLAAYNGVRQMHVEELLTPRLARAQHVETQACDDCRQPSRKVLDAAGVGAAEPEPGFLDGVLRLTQRAQHPVGHRLQMGPVLLETFRQPAAVIHAHMPSSRSVISYN